MNLTLKNHTCNTKYQGVMICSTKDLIVEFQLIPFQNLFSSQLLEIYILHRTGSSILMICQ